MQIAEWVHESWESIKDFFKAMVNTLLDMFKDLIYWLFDVTTEFALVAIDGFAGALDFNPASYFSQIPPEVSNIIGLIGLGEALVIISGAIVIRMLLQLIPFVRFGS